MIHWGKISQLVVCPGLALVSFFLSASGFFVLSMDVCTCLLPHRPPPHASCLFSEGVSLNLIDFTRRFFFSGSGKQQQPGSTPSFPNKQIQTAMASTPSPTPSSSSPRPPGAAAAPAGDGDDERSIATGLTRTPPCASGTQRRPKCCSTHSASAARVTSPSPHQASARPRSAPQPERPYLSCVLWWFRWVERGS